MTEGKLPAAEPEDVLRARATSTASRAHLASAGPGDYVAFCAYLVRTPERDAALTRSCGSPVAPLARTRRPSGTARASCIRRDSCTRAAPNTGVFLQLTADATAELSDLRSPARGTRFATLRNAQALGDLQVLRRRGRRALRVHLGTDVDAGLEALADAMASRRK